jgi:hypothetical protein
MVRHREARPDDRLQRRRAPVERASSVADGRTEVATCSIRIGPSLHARGFARRSSSNRVNLSTYDVGPQQVAHLRPVPNGGRR